MGTSGSYDCFKHGGTASSSPEKVSHTAWCRHQAWSSDKAILHPGLGVGISQILPLRRFREVQGSLLPGPPLDPCEENCLAQPHVLIRAQDRDEISVRSHHLDLVKAHQAGLSLNRCVRDSRSTAGLLLVSLEQRASPRTYWHGQQVVRQLAGKESILRLDYLALRRRWKAAFCGE